MRITNKLNINLSRQEVPEILNAVQGDANTRVVELHLQEGGGAWNVPEGVTAAVAFRKPDGHKGLYDTLPNGAAAVTVAGSVVTATLAPQVLSCAGDVAAAVVLCDKNLNRLATFPFTVHVASDPSAGKTLSNDYYNYNTLKEINDAISDVYSAIESVKVDPPKDSAPAIVCSASGYIVEFSDSSNRAVEGLKIYGKTTQNGKPTPSSPVELVSVGAKGNIGVLLVDDNSFSDGNSFKNGSSGHTNSENNHCICCGAGGAGDHTCDNPIEWLAWNKDTSLPSEGNYYLTKNVTLSTPGEIPEGKTLNLCLNGKTISCPRRVYNVYGTLTITDCTVNGIIKGNTGNIETNGGVFFVYNNATLNIYDGKIQGNVNAGNIKYGGVAYLQGSVMNIHGGTITGGKATNYGGNIYMAESAKLNMYGGTLSGGTSTGSSGGNVAVNSGTFYLQGGTISDGTAKVTGGNIRVGSNGSMIIAGGYVIDGIAKQGNNIYAHEKADLTVYDGDIVTSTPNGLPAIPVSVGGNYTDEDGQQWICDEIDFAKGVYVQRVKRYALTGKEKFTASSTKTAGYNMFWFTETDIKLAANTTSIEVLCTHYKPSTYGQVYNHSNGDAIATSSSYGRLYIYDVERATYTASQFKAYLAELYADGKPVIVQYVLAEPIETQLPLKEMVQFSSLNTTKRKTVVFNDGIAHINIDYVMDTKTYIDKKIAEISKAILNN